jgi:hypothetical protein
VTDQPAWQRSEGRDHVFPVHHPWSFKSVRRSVQKAIWFLPDMDSTGNWYYIHLSCSFHFSLVTSHVPQLNSRTCLFYFRYKPGQVYLEKDVILPYVPNVDLCDPKCVSETQSKRNILLFFRGRLKRNAVGLLSSFLPFDSSLYIHAKLHFS